MSDAAVRMLESIADILRSASPADLASIRETLHELTASERARLARSDVLKFYEDFFANFGLLDDEAKK